MIQKTLEISTAPWDINQLYRKCSKTTYSTYFLKALERLEHIFRNYIEATKSMIFLNFVVQSWPAHHFGTLVDSQTFVATSSYYYKQRCKPKCDIYKKVSSSDYGVDVSAFMLYTNAIFSKDILSYGNFSPTVRTNTLIFGFIFYDINV
jgi:hypothetical protein